MLLLIILVLILAAAGGWIGTLLEVALWLTILFVLLGALIGLGVGRMFTGRRKV